MPITVNGKTYYWTGEVCQIAGTSKNTFFRWVREGRLRDAEYRDRRGWRLFDENDLQLLRNEVNKINFKTHSPEHDLHNEE